MLDETIYVDIPVDSVNNSYFNLSLPFQKLSRQQPLSVPLIVDTSGCNKYSVLMKLELEGLDYSKALSAYDIAVLEAIYTLASVYCFPAFSIEMIARVMYVDSDKKLSDGERTDIAASIEYMRHVDVTIDSSREVKANRKGVKTWYKSYLLPIDEVVIEHKNKVKAAGYKLLKTPAVFEYAEDLHQIASVDNRFMMKLKSRCTVEDMLIMRYVNRKMQLILNGKNSIGPKISYEWYDSKEKRNKGLYSYVGIDLENVKGARKKRSNVHKMVLDIAERYKREGLIEGYKPYRKHGSNNRNQPIVGIEIIPNKHRKRSKK